MNLVFLGKQGVGKGTYAQRFSNQQNIPHLSTGDLLRVEVKTQSELGKKIGVLINQGTLVPDNVVAQILEKRLQQSDCAKGFILDGFPRNLSQAKILEAMLSQIGKKLDWAINFFASDETLLERLAGRWQCKTCNKIYHTTNIPPKVKGKCDVCKSDLFQRDDDKEEAIRKRFAIYEEQTAPLIEYYKQKGLLVEINAERQIPAILLELQKVVEQKKE